MVSNPTDPHRDIAIRGKINTIIIRETVTVRKGRVQVSVHNLLPADPATTVITG